jgi:N-acetylneuraminic acid mutarotase
MPTARFSTAYAVVNNILYVIGGSADGSTPLSVVEAYNPATNSWSTKAPMPTATASASAAVKSGIVYVIGGYANGQRTASVESYNPATNTWTDLAPLLLGKSLPAVGLLGSTIVAAGGLDNSGVTGDNEGYNSTLNTWSNLTADPTARQATCAASISGLLYSAGGSGAGNFGTPLSVLESFSATTKKWTTLTSMPQAVLGPGSAVVNIVTNGVANNMLYCFGGSNDGRLGQGTVYNYVQIYQP